MLAATSSREASSSARFHSGAWARSADGRRPRPPTNRRRFDDPDPRDGLPQPRIEERGQPLAAARDAALDDQALQRELTALILRGPDPRAFTAVVAKGVDRCVAQCGCALAPARRAAERRLVARGRVPDCHLDGGRRSRAQSGAHPGLRPDCAKRSAPSCPPMSRSRPTFGIWSRWSPPLVVSSPPPASARGPRWWSPMPATGARPRRVHRQPRAPSIDPARCQQGQGHPTRLGRPPYAFVRRAVETSVGNALYRNRQAVVWAPAEY